jgi:STE24 endopeptidase
VSVYAVLFSLLNVAASFPLGFYAGFVREKRYGFLNQDLGGWLLDQTKGLAVGLVLQAILLPILYWAIRRWGRSWWLPGAALTIVFVVLVQAVFPIVIAPLFNTFEPLRDESLKQDILTLAHAQGIPADQVYQVDASRQSEHNNAYVAGLLGTQRIVLYDTLLRRFTPREIRSIMGHEMGHYVLHHIWKSTAFASVLVVIALLIVDRAGRRIIRARPGLGIRGLEEPASLPLVVLLLSVLMIPARPIISIYSQAQESAADRFGLEVVKDPEAAASTFLKFGRYDLNERHVHPIIEKILLTHPSVAHRVETARAWAGSHPPRPDPSGAQQPIETPAKD